MTETQKMTADELLAKGPWYVSGARTRHNSMPVLQIISEPTGEVLALIPYSDRTPKAHAECYADATLIAAAPDMRDALKSISWKSADRDNMEFTARITYSQMDEIHAALSKAGAS